MNRLLIFAITLLPSLVLAENIKYTFYVDSPTMVEAYFNIFNAMAAMFQAPTYMEILKLAVLLGGFFTFILAIIKTYQGGSGTAPLGAFVKYLLIAVSLLTLLFSNPVNLYIKTKKIPEYCAPGSTATAEYQIKNSSTYQGASADAVATIVGNIPEALAWTFATVNEVGRGTTNMARAVFSDVDRSGVVMDRDSDFAGYLSSISALLSTRLSDLVADNRFKSGTGPGGGVAAKNDASLLSGLDAIQRDCILIPTSKSLAGNSVIQAFMSTGDLYSTIDDFITRGDVNIYKNPMAANTTTGAGGAGSQPAREKVNVASNYIFEGGTAPKGALVTLNGETMTCKQLWAKVKPAIDNLKASGAVECQLSLKGKLDMTAISVLTGSDMNGGQANAVTSYARQIGINAGLMNRFLESKNKIVPGEMSYAAGKSIADYVTSSLGTGYYMAKMLPYIQMGMRAILYAFFPFVFIIVLLPGGVKNLASYMKTLVWVELWSPTAAILNMFMALQSQQSMSELYNVQGLNPANSLQVFSEATQMASVAGYLYASVPALTWLILTGSGYMLGNITGAVAARMAQNLDSRSVNSDIRSMESLRHVNSERRARGQELMNLAEMDKLQAGQMAANEAGQLAAFTAFGAARTFDAAQGKAITQNYRDLGLYDASKDQSNLDAARTSSYSGVVKDRELATNLGLMDKNGNINKQAVDNYARTKGVEELSKVLGEQAVQGIYSPKERAEMAALEFTKRYGDSQGLSKMVTTKLDAVGGYDNLISQINKGGVEGQRALAQGIAELASKGVWGQMYTAMSNEHLTQLMFENGIGYSQNARNKFASYMAEITAAANQGTEAKSMNMLARDVLTEGVAQVRSLKGNNDITDAQIRDVLHISPSEKLSSTQLTNRLVTHLNTLSSSGREQEFKEVFSHFSLSAAANVNRFADTHMKNYIDSVNNAAALNTYSALREQGFNPVEARVAQETVTTLQGVAKMEAYRDVLGDDYNKIVKAMEAREWVNASNSIFSIASKMKGAVTFGTKTLSPSQLTQLGNTLKNMRP